MAPTNTSEIGTQEKKTPSEIRTVNSQVARTATYLLLFVLYVDRDCYISIRTNRRLDISIRKKKKQNPLPGETTKVRHVEQTAHRMVDLISS